MNKDQYKRMSLRIVYNAKVNGIAVKVWRPDSGGIVDYDEPAREYEVENVELGTKVK